MTTKLSILLVALLAMCSAVSAQSKISEGTVKYEMELEGVKDATLSMLHGSTITTFFKGEQNKVRGEFMGGMAIVNFMLDGAAQEGLMLMDMMAQRKAIKIDKNSYQTSNQNAQQPPVTHTNETKKIAGYTCKKAIMKGEDGSNIVVYVCEQIQPKNNSFMQKMVGDLKGFPLAIEISLPENGGKMKLLATEVSKKTPDKKEFSLQIPQGYQVTTMAELQKTMGGKAGKLFGQ